MKSDLLLRPLEGTAGWVAVRVLGSETLSPPPREEFEVVRGEGEYGVRMR